MKKDFDAIVADHRVKDGAVAHTYEGANKGPIDPNNWGPGPQVPTVPPVSPVTGSDAYPSSSPRIAQEFMAQGRPSGEPLQLTGSRPGDVAMGLEILTPQPGQGFKEWALRGWNGEILSGPKGTFDYDKKPGASAPLKANIPVVIKEQ